MWIRIRLDPDHFGLPDHIIASKYLLGSSTPLICRSSRSWRLSSVSSKAGILNQSFPNIQCQPFNRFPNFLNHFIPSLSPITIIYDKNSRFFMISTVLYINPISLSTKILFKITIFSPPPHTFSFFSLQLCRANDLLANS